MKILLILILSLTAQISFAQRGTGDIGSAEIPTGNSITEKFRAEIEGKKLILSKEWGQSSCDIEFKLPAELEENVTSAKDQCETESLGVLSRKYCTRIDQKIINGVLVIEKTLSETGFYSKVGPQQYRQYSLSYNSSKNTLQITEAHSAIIQKICIYKDSFSQKEPSL